MVYTICFDTICTGFQPVLCNDKPMEFATEDEAIAEMDTDEEFYGDCFVCPLEYIGHKTIFYGSKENAKI